MKKLCFAALLAVCGFCSNLNALTFDWMDYLDSARITTYDVQTDLNHNVFVVGSFQGYTDFDPGPGTAFQNTAGGFNHDGFIAKYNSAGVYQWVLVTGSITTENFERLMIAPNGDLIVFGTFFGNYDMDPGAGTATAIHNGTSHPDFMLNRFDNNGNYLWGHYFGGNHSEFVGDMTLDNAGNIILTGNFTNSCDLDPGAGTTMVYAAGGTLDNDIFCSAFSPAGNFLWGWSIGTTASELAYSLETDANNYIYMTGHFNGTMDFDPSAAQNNVTHSYAGFLAKYTPTGNFAWTQVFDFNPWVVRINAQNNLFLAGQFLVTQDVDPGVGVTTLTAVDGYDIALLCFDTAGSFIRAASIAAPLHQMIYDGDIDINGNFYFTGQIEGSCDVDPGAGTTTITAASWRDPYFAVVNAQLNLVNALHIPCSVEGYGQSITCDNLGNYIVQGRFAGTADFDPSAATYLQTNNAANQATYFAKYSTTTGLNESETVSSISLFPNPCNTYVNLNSSSDFHNEKVQLFSTSGQLAREYTGLNGTNMQLNVEGLAEGIYFLSSPSGRFAPMKIVVE